MNVNTGQIKDLADVDEKDRHKYVLVRRDLTALEKLTGQVKLYSPCGCGSGKKFKFCCYQKEVK